MTTKKIKTELTNYIKPNGHHVEEHRDDYQTYHMENGKKVITQTTSKFDHHENNDSLDNIIAEVLWWGVSILIIFLVCILIIISKSLF